MRNRLVLLVAPLALSGSLLLVSPAPARAANGVTETGTTTYEVVPSKGVIAVTIKVSIYNGTPNKVTAGGETFYYYVDTHIAVEAEASAVAVTSNAGSVSQSLASSDKYYRYIKLTYPAVYYGQTRVVTATYTIPAAPHAPGGYRAVSAYASMCIAGNGFDTGTVSVVIPDGFDLNVDDGGALTRSSDTGGKQVYSSGTQSSPYKFWSCIDAENPHNLTHTPLNANGQLFDMEAWPEDPTWSQTISGDVSHDVQSLEDLTGLFMPGGTVEIIEAGDWQLGEYGGMYNAAMTSAWIPETVPADTIAHELSHIWFNRNLFHDKWVSEGLAGYSEKAAGEGNYKACAKPGAYPGSGTPNLITWLMLDNNATAQEQAVSDYQYAASCYIWTDLANLMGADDFKDVLRAAAANEMAYQGAKANEVLAGAGLPLTSKGMLDLIDERGMVPAGLSDLDEAQKLLSDYGVFSSADLAGRSEARATYHALVTAAGAWKLPLAIRAPMSSWDFVTAQAAMATAQQIVDMRDGIVKQLSNFSMDGTQLQHDFENAADQTDLESLLTLMKKESDAADKIGQATKLRDGSHGIFQTIGLVGADTQTPLKQANADLAAVKPDSAGAAAQSVIDLVGQSNDVGILRLGLLLAMILAIAFVVTATMFLRRRRQPVPVPAAGPGWMGPAAGTTPGQPGYGNPSASNQWQGAQWGRSGPPPGRQDGQWSEPGGGWPVPPTAPTSGWQQPASPPPASPWQTPTAPPPPASASAWETPAGSPPPASGWQTPATPPAAPWQPSAGAPASLWQAPVDPAPVRSPSEAPSSAETAEPTPWEMPGLPPILESLGYPAPAGDTTAAEPGEARSTDRGDEETPGS